jgi:RNA recognition motif-containing protein
MATNEKGNLIIKNIDKAVSQEDIFNLFNEVGPVHACKLETFPDGTSRGFCYIQFKEEESANLAMEKLNGHKFNEKAIEIETHKKKSQRENTE